MLNKLIMALGATALLAVPAQAAGSQVQVGVLTCDVDAGVGLIIGSSKQLECTFERDDGRIENYTGAIRKLGLDVGVTGRTKIVWVVFAATDTPIGRHSLAGRYVGASTEATVGVGLGANVLVGGSNRSFALQPFSVQGQTGLNLSVAFAGLTLR